MPHCPIKNSRLLGILESEICTLEVGAKNLCVLTGSAAFACSSVRMMGPTMGLAEAIKRGHDDPCPS